MDIDYILSKVDLPLSDENILMSIKNPSTKINYENFISKNRRNFR